MADPKQHAQRRRLFAQNYSNTAILKFETVVGQKIDLALAKIQRDAKAANADVMKWFTFMATDVAGRLHFGTSFGMLEKEEVSSSCRRANEYRCLFSLVSPHLPFFSSCKIRD